MILGLPLFLAVQAQVGPPPEFRGQGYKESFVIKIYGSDLDNGNMSHC